VTRPPGAPGSAAPGSKTVQRAALLLIASLALGPWRAAHADESDSRGRYETTVHARGKREPTVLVLTGRDLAERGVDNLAEALERIPEVQVRAGGRGDTRVDLRGAKQRSVLVLIDGVPVDEPYFGAFDLSSIPVTDIVEVRVTLSPASPLEGPGGDGGTVEVLTLRARGGRRLSARARGATSPDALAAFTGRGDLGRGVALRGSGGGRWGAPVFDALSPGNVPGKFTDANWQAHGALRLEVQRPGLRFTTDGFYEHRDFYVPPTSETGADVQHVKNENAGRVVAGLDYQRRQLRIAAGAYFMVLQRDSDSFEDYTLSKFLLAEKLTAWRSGAALFVDRAYRRGELRAGVSARLSYDHEGADITATGSPAVSASAGIAEAALGGRLWWRWLRVDGALGVALPVGHPVATWPEAKLQVTIAPHPAVDFLIVGARKGRVPTLREEFSPSDGNPDVRPEQTSYGELSVQARPARWLSLRATGYLRYTEGQIRLDPATGSKVVNLDAITVRGLEARLELRPCRVFSAGVSYQLGDASSEALGLYPIDNFARHRAEGWVSLVAGGVGGVYIRARYVGERRDKQLTLPDYTVVDLSGWVKIAPQVRITLRVDNAGDVHYDLRRGLTSQGAVAAVAVEGIWE